MKAFCEILRSLRCEKKLSQGAAAKHLGVSQSLLSHYENGAREPKLDFIHIICDYYKVSADYLLGRSESRELHALHEPKCEKRGKLFAKAYWSVLDALDSHSDPAVSESAVDCLLITAQKLMIILENPNTLYDPMNDAELKLAEAALISHLRK